MDINVVKNRIKINLKNCIMFLKFQERFQLINREFSGTF